MVKRWRILRVINKHRELSRFLPFVSLISAGEGFAVREKGGMLIFEVPTGRDGYEEFISLLHLIGHILLYHHARSDVFGRNEVWDTACDFAVSNFIYKDVILKLSPSVRGKFLKYLKPFDKEFLNMSTEEIYLTLLKGGNVRRAADDHSSLTSFSTISVKETIDKVLQEEEGKPTPSNQAGSVVRQFPLSLTKIPPSIINIIYAKYTETFMEDFPAVDIPTLGLGRVVYTTPLTPYPHFVFLIDCSDSMLTGKWVETAVRAVWTLTNFIVSTFPRGKVTVITADTRVTGLWSGWSDLHNLHGKLSVVRGFGGTDIISPFIELVKEIHPFPFCVTIFSDYEFDARLRYPLDEVFSTFRRIPLYIAVFPRTSYINSFYYQLYMRGSGNMSSYVWTVDALKLFKEELPHVKVYFDEF